MTEIERIPFVQNRDEKRSPVSIPLQAWMMIMLDWRCRGEGRQGLSIIISSAGDDT